MPGRLFFLCFFPAVLCGSLAWTGCRAWDPPRAGGESVGHLIARDQLVISADFPLAADHRLLDELTTLRTRLHDELALPRGEQTIDVHLFASEAAYRGYLERHYPAASGRRAAFVKTERQLAVYAWWGDHVAEDLRHEVTHGYLHAVVSDVPLWLDEGLAEFYEVAAVRDGRHAAHIELLLSALRDGRWHPNLDRLQQLATVDQMQQIEYAEAWLWTHFLLRSTDARHEMLRQYLQALILAEGDRAVPPPRPLAEQLAARTADDLGTQLVAHLLLLGRLD